MREDHNPRARRAYDLGARHEALGIDDTGHYTQAHPDYRQAYLAARRETRERFEAGEAWTCPECAARHGLCGLRTPVATEDAEETEIRKGLGVRVSRARRRKSWSLQELADRADLSKTYVWRVERRPDIYSPTLRTICALAAALDVSPAHLLFGASDPEAEGGGGC